MSNQTTDNLIKGGAFLVEDITYDQVFTPEDYSDEHKMIAKTSEDFVVNEVLPQVEHLENHEFDRSVKLLKHAGDIGLLGADVPEEYNGLGLDKISFGNNYRKNGACRWVRNYSRCTRRDWIFANRIIWK